MRSKFPARVAGAVLAFVAGMAESHPSGPAPASTAGLDIVLTIEHTESSLPGGFPTMGAVTQTYAADGSYTYAGFGGPNHLTGTGTYTYLKTGPGTATEDAVQYSNLFTLPYHMEYTFQTSSTGHWKQFFAGGLIVFEGSFIGSPSRSGVQWAPASLAGATLLLFGTGENNRGLSIVSYGESDYRAFDRQSKRPATGTYTAKRMSAKSWVVENTSVDSQTVRSLAFTGEGSGVWKGARLPDGARTEGFFLLLP